MSSKNTDDEYHHLAKRQNDSRIKDLFEYKEFLRQCPNLPNYIWIQPSLTTNRGFDFGVYDYSNLLNDGDYTLSLEANSTPSPEANSKEIPTTPEPKPTSHRPPAVTPRNQIQELTNSDKNEDSQPAQAPQLPPLTQFSEETNESYVEVQNDDVNPKLTPKQDNTSLKNPDATKVSTRTIDSTFAFCGLSVWLTYPANYVWKLPFLTESSLNF